MEMRRVDLGLILDYERTFCPRRKRIHTMGQGHGFAGAQYDGVDESQVHNFEKGRTEKRIRAETGSIVTDIVISDVSSKLDCHYAGCGIDGVYKRGWRGHAHACLIGTMDENCNQERAAEFFWREQTFRRPSTMS